MVSQPEINRGAPPQSGGQKRHPSFDNLASDATLSRKYMAQAQHQSFSPYLGRVLGEVPARNGGLGEVLRKVLVLLVLGRDTKHRDFSKHFPEHPVFWPASPRALSRALLGVGGFALL